MSEQTSVSSFSFHAVGLGSVLKLNRLSVPLYQREYAWREEKVEQLLRDLQKAKDDQTDYFIGTIVTIPKAKSETLNVVDGQQRLTTTALFLAGIRDYVRKREPDSLIVESIENEFLSIIDRRQGKRVPRLQLNVDDNAFFDQMIAREPIPIEPSRESHRRLLDAKRFIAGFIKQIVATYDKHDGIAVLNDWIYFLEHKASVILLKAPDSAHAFRMFETLNDRGQKVSQADLVKNYLFEQAGDRVVEAQAKWSSMLNTLEEIDDEDRHINFLRHILIATRAFTRADRVFGTVQTKVKGETNSLLFLGDLERLATVYVATYRPDSDQWTGYPVSALKAIKVLSLLDLKPFRPLILSVTEKFTPTEGAKALALFVAIGVRILIAGRTNSGQIEQNCAQAALQSYRGELSTARELRDRLENIVPVDAEFEQLFATASSSKSALGRYYLHSLERVRDGDPEPYFEAVEDPAQITLEHILPKTPEAGEWDQFDADDVKRYSRRLGNMCLLHHSSNSTLKSGSFRKKKPILADVPFSLTSEIAEYDDWTAHAIQTRQAGMAELAVRAWPVSAMRL
jgi:hypothetical protein